MHGRRERFNMTTGIDETSPSYRGWRIVVLCFTVAVFSWGFAFYGQSSYLAELQRLHGWSSFTVSTASTMSILLVPYWYFSLARPLTDGDRDASCLAA